MPLTIPDDVLREAGLTERDALIEIACRLFDAGFLHLPQASRLAGLSRVEMEDELMARKIPVYRYTLEEYQKDIDAMEKLWGSSCSS